MDRMLKKGDEGGSTVVRALAHQCSLGSIPDRCHIWVEYVVGSRLASKVFPGFSGFPPSTKTNTPNSNSIWKHWMKRLSGGYATANSYLFIYLFILFIIYGKCISTASVISLQGKGSG